jgi:hypothetical protein
MMKVRCAFLNYMDIPKEEKQACSCIPHSECVMLNSRPEEEEFPACTNISSNIMIVVTEQVNFYAKHHNQYLAVLPWSPD